MAEQNTYMQEYSQLDRDVIHFADERLKGLVLDDLPKEAFNSPAVLVNSFMDNSFKEDVVLFHEMDDPMVLNQYLLDNVEEICTVLDTLSERKDFTVEDIVENPKQVMFDVYAEEATQLISKTPFYFNQNVCQETSDNRLNQEDISMILSSLNNEPLKNRAEAVIRFDGIEDGKPYVVEFEYDKASKYIDSYLKEDYQKEANLSAHRILDATANNFRIQGPTEAMNDFNLRFEYMAKDLEKSSVETDKTVAKDVRDWIENQAKLFFHTTREGGFLVNEKDKEERKVNLKVRDREREDNEHTMGSRSL